MSTTRASRPIPTGTPAGPVHEVDEALAQEQVLAREMVVVLPHTDLGIVRTLGSPLKLTGTPTPLRTASPTYGEHTRELLAAMGLDGADIDASTEGEWCGEGNGGGEGALRGNAAPHRLIV